MNTLATTEAPSLSPVPLADMEVAQLAVAFANLDEARNRYDRLSGICGTLQGLVLLEVKRKVGHGHYGKWLEENFPKSHDTARNCMRAADEFISRLMAKNTPEAKLRARSSFDATQLLLGDLATNLAAIEEAKLDMSHPVVEAVSLYVGERSFRQLLLDLGPARRGGDHRARDEEGNLLPRERRTNAQIERDEFENAANQACEAAKLYIGQVLTIQGPQEERAYWVLDDGKLEALKMAAYDLHRACLEYQHRRAAKRRAGK